MAEGGMPTQLYTCEICGQDGLNEEDMKSHVLIAHIEGNITCPFCELEGTTADEMNFHINAEHLDFMSPTCENGLPLGGAMSSLSSTSSEDTVTPKDGTPLGSSGSASLSSLSSASRDSGIESAMEVDTTSSDDCFSSGGSGRDIGTLNSSYSISSKLSSSDSEQSLKRSKLFLDVTQKSPKKSSGKPQILVNGLTVENGRNIPGSSTSSNSSNNGSRRTINNSSSVMGDPNANIEYFTCPLCDWETTSSTEIQRHVNVQHLDVLSPSKPQQQCKQQPSKQSNSTHQQKTGQTLNQQQQRLDMPSTSYAHLYECPICGLRSESPNTLQVHVNTKHLDILSPENPQSSSGVSVDTGQQLSSDETEGGHLCPICAMDFNDTISLAAHVDGHFSSEHTPVQETEDSLLAQEIERQERAALQQREQKEFQKLQAQYGMDNKGSYNKQAEKQLDRAVSNGQMSISDYYSYRQDLQQANVMGVDDGRSCSKGIIPRLKQYLAVPTVHISRAWLCSNLDHYAASYGDKGWGCGYRNLQMLLTCLSNNCTYEHVLFNGRPLIPSIPKIQRLIETAWQKGFDLQGCEQLGSKVINTSKWIGATEIVATLSSLRIKCQLVDFHSPSAPDGSHPKLFEWVKNYFQKEGEFKPSLYLQHQGHSRTIVGIEELKDKSLRLLLFDPSTNRKQMQQFLSGPITGNLMRTLRRTPSSMKAKQYQIVAVVGVLDDKEYEESKIIKSDRIH